MAEFIPELSDIVEFPIGEHPRIEDGEIPLMWLVTFIKPNVAVTAKYLGLYLKRIVGDITNLDYRANIYVYDPLWTVEPETPADTQTKTTLASNVDLKSILIMPEGWKTIPINEFTFEADRTYIIMFEMASKPYIVNGVVDEIIISAAQKFDIPIMPPDYPFPESQGQAKSAFGIDREKTGYFYYDPLAIAAYGEAPIQPPPVESGIIVGLTAPELAYEGENVPITATIQNTGEITTLFSIFFYKPGWGIARTIELSPGQSGNVTAEYKMPNQDMEVVVNLTHRDVTDDTKSIVVGLGAPPVTPPGETAQAAVPWLMALMAGGIAVSYILIGKK